MGCSHSNTPHTAPPRNPVPLGITRLCVAGFWQSFHAGRSRSIAHLIAQKFPVQYETWFYFDSCYKFYDFTAATFADVTFPAHLKGHSSSPFVWIERTPGNVIEPVGGREEFAAWVLSKAELAADADIKRAASTWSIFDALHDIKRPLLATCGSLPSQGHQQQQPRDVSA